MTESKSLFILILVLVASWAGHSIGKNNGQKQGKRAGYQQAILELEDEISDLKQLASSNYKDGYNDGMQFAEADCDNRVSANNSANNEVRTSELKEAFKLGYIKGRRTCYEKTK